MSKSRARPEPPPVTPEQLAIRRRILKMSPEHLKLFVQACRAEERRAKAEERLAKRRAEQKPDGAG